MGGHTPIQTEIDPQTVAESQRLWSTFLRMTKYLTVAIIVLLALMALFLV